MFSSWLFVSTSLETLFKNSLAPCNFTGISQLTSFCTTPRLHNHQDFARFNHFKFYCEITSVRVISTVKNSLEHWYMPHTFAQTIYRDLHNIFSVCTIMESPIKSRYILLMLENVVWQILTWEAFLRIYTYKNRSILYFKFILLSTFSTFLTLSTPTISVLVVVRWTVVNPNCSIPAPAVKPFLMNKSH